MWVRLINQSGIGGVYKWLCTAKTTTEIIYWKSPFPNSNSHILTFCCLLSSDFDLTIDWSCDDAWVLLPRGSSKRVSSSTRWSVGSLVPQISLSVMMTWESNVSHSPGPSCKQSYISELTHNQHWIECVYICCYGTPRLTAGCCEEVSTLYRPWCPRLSLCSTPRLSGPGPVG